MSEPQKMAPKVKAKWLKALRSGKFAQGHEVLCHRSPGQRATYCCLGVLAKVAGYKLEREAEDSWNYGIREDVDYVTTAKLPFDCAADIGISEAIQNEAVARNDGREYYGFQFTRRQNFRQIANWIEKNL